MPMITFPATGIIADGNLYCLVDRGTLCVSDLAWVTM